MNKYMVNINDLKSINNRKDIPTLLMKMQAENICEIGVKEGANFKNLLVSCIKKAVAIDIWEETGIRSENDDSCTKQQLDNQYNNMLTLAFKNPVIQVIKNFSLKSCDQFDNNFFDFVYIDADHTESAVYSDLNAWWSKVRIGGVLAGHDYIETTISCGVKFGVVSAVNRFVKENNLLLHVDNEIPWHDWFILKQ